MTKASGTARAQAWEHTALAVANLDCAIAFYRDAFGYKVCLEERGKTDQMRSMVGLPSLECDLAQLRSPISEHVLELLEFRNVPLGREEHGPTRPGAAHISFVVDDLNAALAAVKRIGGSVLGEITWFEDGRRVYCRDSSSVVIELAEHRAGP